MNMQSTVIKAIDEASLNRGLSGANWLSDRRNIACVSENGDVTLFDYEGDKDYQIHVIFKSRGRAAIQSARESIQTMFDIHGADLIFGLVPDFRRDVKLLARWVGMKSAGIRMTDEGPCELFVLSAPMKRVN